MLLPALRRLEEGFGCPRVLVGRRAIRQYDLRRTRMQSDQHGVGSQCQCVLHDIKSGRQINGAWAAIACLQRFCVVSGAVAFGSQVAHVHPCIARGQSRQVGDGAGGRSTSGSALKSVWNSGVAPISGKAESMRECLHSHKSRPGRQTVCRSHARRQKEARRGKRPLPC